MSIAVAVLENAVYPDMYYQGIPHFVIYLYLKTQIR